MNHSFDDRIDRHGTSSMKWDISEEMSREWGITAPWPKDPILYVSTADMDFRCPPCIQEAMQKVVDQNLYGYYFLDPRITPDYYDALIHWNQRRYGWTFQAQDIIYTDGTINAVAMSVKALTQPEDTVLLSPPVYSPFYNIVQDMSGRKLATSHLVNTNGYYAIDWEDFEAQLQRPEVTAYILCSPQNPTGRVWTVEELKRIYDLCTKNGVVVIADEIHGDLTRKDHPFTPIGSVVDGKNLVVCSGANKTFNIAALHASHIIVTNPEYREKIQAQLDWNAPNPFTIAAVVAAYNHGEQWLEDLREYLDGNIDFAVNFLHQKMPKVTVCRPEGTYILWMDFSAYGLTAEQINQRVFTQGGIGAEYGLEFDPEQGESFVRFCLASPRSFVEEVFLRLEGAFSDLT